MVRGELVFFGENPNMAYTAADLTTFFKNANLGADPSAAQSLLLASYAAQTQSGSLSDTAAVSRIVDMMDGTTAVAVQTYQFFTNSTPSAAGLAYLVNSATNANDLNDAAGLYNGFNIENRYINFAINLGTGAGAGAASFASTYGTLSFRDVVAVAYETIIGTAAAQAAGIDVTAAINYISRAENEAFLRSYVATRNPGQDINIAIRAAVVGQIMSAGATSNVGNYNAATTRLITGAMDGTFDNGITDTAGVNLLTAFPNVVVPTSLALTTSTDNLTGTAGVDNFIASNTTLTALDTLDGGAGADTLTISDVAGADVAGGLGNVTGALPGGLTIKNIETINLSSAGTVNLDLTASPGITGVTNFNIAATTGTANIKAVAGMAVSVVDSAGTVTVNGASASQTVTTAGGYALSGSTGAIKVTDTAQAAVNSTIDGGTTVDLTTTTTGAGSVTIGGTTKATGAINVTENLKGTGALTGGNITVTGGTVDTIKVNASQATVGLTTTVGTIAVNGAATATSASVTQTAAIAGVGTTAAQTGITEAATVTFNAMVAAETITVGGLTFKATGTVTPAQAAAAFANLTANATQGNSTLGTYSGSLTAPYTSAAASATAGTVVFTASTANSNAADLTSAGSITAPGLAITQGQALIAAVAGKGAVANGAVAITSSLSLIHI